MSTFPPEVLHGFITEAQSYLTNLQNVLAQYETAPEKAQLDTMREDVMILSTSIELIGLESIATLAQTASEILEGVADAGTSLSADDCQQLTTLFEQIDSQLTVINESEDELDLPDADDTYVNKVGSDDDPTTPYLEPIIRLDEQLLAVPDLPEELLKIFVMEAAEHNEAIQLNLDGLQKAPDNFKIMSELRRVTHTLKGAAASVGFGQISHMAHMMEELLERHIEEKSVVPNSTFTLLLDSADVLQNILEPDNPAALIERYGQLDYRYLTLLQDAYPDPPAQLRLQAAKTEQAETVTPEPAPSVAMPRVENVLRLPLEDVDKLINRVGEIIINRAGLERHLGRINTMLNELDRSTKRLRQVAHNLDTQIEATVPIPVQQRIPDLNDPNFDPLELDRYSLLYQYTRELEEIASDTGDINSQLNVLTEDMDAGLSHERRLTTELQDGLMLTRLVPFFELETRIRSIIRRTASDLGKTVDVKLFGFDTKVDKMILDTFSDPLLHLLRNSVDHGIETAGQRQKAKKSETGLITIGVARQRGRIVITITDDGGGIDLKKIRQRAIARGFINADARLRTEQLYNLLFEEGFSTAQTVTQTSGRGVGLDIVKRAVNRLQGTIRVDSVVGEGTTFTISVPATLAIVQALFVRSSNQEFAIPLEQVNSILRLDKAMYKQMDEQNIIRLHEQPIAIHDLSDFVGRLDLPTPPNYGLIIDTGEQQTAVLVDSLVGINEAVVKSLGTHLRRVPGVVGATIGGDGRVTLILDVVEVAGGERIYSAPVTEFIDDHPTEIKASHIPHILVVDDSLSVRRVVCSFLNRLGWHTTDAKDGIDALEKLNNAHPDVALVDIEMPRMNGYELLTQIKSEARFNDLPVVFLTSRSGNKHRDRAYQLGVDGYLVKPYREDELMNELQRVMG